MPNPIVTVTPPSPKPGETVTLTYFDYSDGTKYRDVDTWVDDIISKSVPRFSTRSKIATKTMKAALSGTHIVKATGMVGCDEVSYTVQAPPPPIDPPPVEPPPTTTTIPPMPAGADLLAKDFADGHLDLPGQPGKPLYRQVFYVDDHAGDFMGTYCDYKGAPASVISFPTDGDRKYLRLSSFPKVANQPAGVWWAVLLSTGADGNGGNPTFVMRNGYLQVAIRESLGYAAWPDPTWARDDVPPWGSDEPDLAEALEDGKIHFNVLPYKKNVAVLSRPDIGTKWYIFGMALFDDHITFTEGPNHTPIGRWDGQVADMNLLADSKVGFPWSGIAPDARTPNPTYSDLAWVTFRSAIPAGL